MSGFRSGEQRWIRQLGNLRNTIRQDVIRRQLEPVAEAGATVLDVGCGQGTQAVHLAARGCVVTGIEPSAALRTLARAAAATAGVVIEVLAGSIDQLDAVLPERRFDLVCAHGLLMYLPDRRRALAQLADRVGPAGRLSVTFRNGHALAMRPALRQDWAGALAAFESTTYTNELGVEATADRLEELIAHLDSTGFEIEAWYGVRVFNDAIPTSADPPVGEDLAALLEAEDRAGRTDPYRWMASQLHVIARRAGVLDPAISQRP